MNGKVVPRVLAVLRAEACVSGAALEGGERREHLAEAGQDARRGDLLQLELGEVMLGDAGDVRDEGADRAGALGEVGSGLDALAEAEREILGTRKRAVSCERRREGERKSGLGRCVCSPPTWT